MTASPDDPHALVYKDGKFYVRAERIIETSPTPPDFFAESANKSATPPDAQVGLPSEEALARALAEALRREQIPDDIWRKQVAGFRDLEAMFPDYAQGYSLATDAFRQARAILDLIRPAFEQVKATRDSHYRTIEMMAQENAVYLEHWQFAERRALSAEAKLAQAVEAAGEVLKHRVGDLPTAGYLRDNNASRRALAALAPIAAPGAAMEAT